MGSAEMYEVARAVGDEAMVATSAQSRTTEPRVPRIRFIVISWSKWE
jgi:hypothetical protein